MSGPSYSEQLQHVVNAYLESGLPWPATTRQIAAWALRENLWAPQPHALISQCAEQLARAMREEYIKDPQGRAVRAKHAARTERDGEQLVLWADIRTASRQHMEIALQQRRQQVVGDCHQLKTDADSFNENGDSSPPILLIFDFTDDLAELEAMESLRR
ncbi:MAG: hypothetical protein ACR2PL_18805 [Dehalococcoidia bacterium]